MLQVFRRNDGYYAAEWREDFRTQAHTTQPYSCPIEAMANLLRVVIWELSFAQELDRKEKVPPPPPLKKPRKK